jgi:ABC-type transport system involved in multi-copper enzyme maturation permease subunit
MTGVFGDGVLAGVGTVFRRELATVLRTPGYGVLAGGLLAVLGLLVAVGGGGATGFVPTVVDLLLPAELLVPVLATVLGYRALLSDVVSGELAVIRTYPVSVAGYVVGILLARLVALVAVVGLPFAAVGGYVWLTAAPDTGIFATHTGVDSPLLYVRFLALSLLLGAAFLATSMWVSAAATSRRNAVALAVLAFLVGTLGGDLSLIGSLMAGADPSAVAGRAALTPNGAFRGLVFETVIGVSFAQEQAVVDVGRAVGSLVGWTVLGSFAATATLAVRHRVNAAIERVRYTT